jgi:RTC4-like domain
MPGFSYGELGSMILHQTLYNIFPPSSFDAQSITPLTPQEFIQCILVPEAALALIMEDTGQDRAQAAQTMRESAGYGVAMFPDTSEGPGVGAGEDIVLERARARRRELEDEERMEALQRSGGSEEEHLSKNKGTKRPKKLGSATTTDVEEATVAQRKMKRKKAGSRTDAESGPDGNLSCGDRAMSASKSTRGVSSNLEAEPSSPHSSPPQSSPLQARPESHFPGSSSPEQIRSHLSKIEPRALRSEPKSTQNDSSNGSKRGFAGLDVEPGPLPTAMSSQRGSNGHSKSDPIDVDDLEISAITDAPSPCAHQPPVVVTSGASGLPQNWCARGSSDAKEREANFDLPTPKPKPRGRLVGRDAAVDRPSEPDKPVSLLTEQKPGRDSSVEYVE